MKLFILICLLGVLSTVNSAIAQDEQPQRVVTDIGVFFVVGDQWINEEQILSSDPNVRGSKPAQVVLWPDGVIPIVFDKDLPASVRDTVWQACRRWASVAKITCQVGEYKKAKLTIAPSYLGAGGCWAMLGKDKYFLWIERRMNLGKNCHSYKTVLHEFGHVLGLTHEHQRMDRDQYIDVISKNIKKGFLSLNYKLNFESQKGDLLSDYDFLSIMHYGRFSYSKNGQETLRVKTQFNQYADLIGTAQDLSELDIQSIQKLYGVR